MPLDKLEKKYGHKRAIAIILAEKQQKQKGSRGFDETDAPPLKGLKKAKPQF